MEIAREQPDAALSSAVGARSLVRLHEAAETDRNMPAGIIPSAPDAHNISVGNQPVPALGELVDTQDCTRQNPAV